MNVSVRLLPNVGQRRGTGEEIILDPHTPLQSAREFLSRLHLLDGVTTLRHRHGTFFSYDADAGLYRERAEGAVKSDLYRFMGDAMRHDPKSGGLVPYQPNQTGVSAVLDALRAECYATDPAPCWLDADADPGVDPRDLIACPNGLLHVPDRTLFPATPTFFTTNALTFPFDARAARPSRWLRFLNELWPNDREARDTLQEIMGYLLVPRTDQQKAFMFVGRPRSGKGTIGRIVRRLVGDPDCCAPTLGSLGREFGMQNLIGKTLALIADAADQRHALAPP